MQSSPTVGCQQETYPVRHQDLVKEPLVSIAQSDHVYVALQLGWFIPQMTEHPFDLSVTIFVSFERKTGEAALFSFLID
jgi:hypothetical protein